MPFQDTLLKKLCEMMKKRVAKLLCFSFYLSSDYLLVPDVSFPEPALLLVPVLLSPLDPLLLPDPELEFPEPEEPEAEVPDPLPAPPVLLPLEFPVFVESFPDILLRSSFSSPTTSSSVSIPDEL